MHAESVDDIFWDAMDSSCKEEAYYDAEEPYFDAADDFYYDCRQFKSTTSPAVSTEEEVEQVEDTTNKPYFKQLPFMYPSVYLIFSCVMITMYWVGMMLHEVGVHLHLKMQHVAQTEDGFQWLKHYFWPPP